MRNLLSLLLLLSLSLSLSAQSKYYTRSGHIWFFSETPLENIEAHNRQVTALLNPDKSVAVSLLQKSFKFPIALMQEHFNESYVESNEFPRATFNGELVDFNFNKIGKQEVSAKGVLSMHGVAKKIETPVTLRMDEGHVYVNSVFTVDPKDYDIEIPTNVAGKIAESIVVHVELDLVEAQ